MQAPPPLPKVVKCPHCGNENAGTNTVCSNCGSPLPGAAAVRAVPAAGAGTQPKTKKPNWLLIGGIVGFLVVCCIAIAAIYGLLVIPTKSVQATVSDVRWETSVPVQEIQAVRHNNEAGSAPSDAYDVSCHDESKDVCEQKTIDKGNGYSEVVEECHTETQKYCSYTVDEWTTIQTYSLDGNNLQPVYDTPNISSDQRLGSQSAELTVNFSITDGDQKTYSPDSISEFQKFVIGSKWTLKMNALGGITSVEQ
jgi:hypothetical protein